MSEEKTLADEEALKLKVCSLKAYAMASVLANHFQDELMDFTFQLYSVLELSRSIHTKNTEESIMSCVEGLIQKAVEKNIPGFFINDEIKKELCIILFSSLSRVGNYGKNEDYPKMDIARFLFDQDANEDTIKSKVLQYFHYLVKTVEDDRSSLSMLNKIVGAPSHLYFVVEKFFRGLSDLLIKPQEENRERIEQIDYQLFDLQLYFMMTHPIFGRMKEMIKTFFILDFEYLYPQELNKRPYDIAFKVNSMLLDDKEEFYEEIVLDFARFNDEKWGQFPKVISHLILLEKNDEDFIKSAEANDAAVLAYAIGVCYKQFIRRYLGIVSLEQVKQILELLPEDDVKKLRSHMALMSKFKNHVTIKDVVLDFSTFKGKEWDIYASAATLLVLAEKNDADFIMSAEANNAAVLAYAIHKKNDDFIGRYLGTVSSTKLKQTFEILPVHIKNKFRRYLSKTNRFQTDISSACEKNQYRTLYNYLSIPSRYQDLRHEVVTIFRKISLPTLFGDNDEVDTESNHYHHFEQSLFEYLDYIQLSYPTNDERLIEKHKLASQRLLELLNPDLSSKERITLLKIHLEELLHENPEVGIRINRGTGCYFWYGFFNGIKNPFDNRYSRSTTETRAIELYESLISLQLSIPDNDEVPDDIYSLSSAGG